MFPGRRQWARRETQLATSQNVTSEVMDRPNQADAGARPSQPEVFRAAGPSARGPLLPPLSRVRRPCRGHRRAWRRRQRGSVLDPARGSASAAAVRGCRLAGGNRADDFSLDSRRGFPARPLPGLRRRRSLVAGLADAAHGCRRPRSNRYGTAHAQPVRHTRRAAAVWTVVRAR